MPRVTKFRKFSHEEFHCPLGVRCVFLFSHLKEAVPFLFRNPFWQHKAQSACIGWLLSTVQGRFGCNGVRPPRAIQCAPPCRRLRPPLRNICAPILCLTGKPFEDMWQCETVSS